MSLDGKNSISVAYHVRVLLLGKLDRCCTLGHCCSCQTFCVGLSWYFFCLFLVSLACLRMCSAHRAKVYSFFFYSSNSQVPGMFGTHILPNNVIFLGARCCSSAKGVHWFAGVCALGFFSLHYGILIFFLLQCSIRCHLISDHLWS